MKSEEFASAIETIIKYNANEKDIYSIQRSIYSPPYREGLGVGPHGADDGRNDIYIMQ